MYRGHLFKSLYKLIVLLGKWIKKLIAKLCTLFKEAFLRKKLNSAFSSMLILF